MTFQRAFVTQLAQRFSTVQPSIQVVVGPRQVGKTTGVHQLLAQGAWPHHYANADDVLVSDRSWLLEQWQQALLQGEGALLVVDEIQKAGFCVPTLPRRSVTPSCWASYRTGAIPI